MFDGYKIVCVTPAGRRRYLELLVPQILSSSLVDEYHLWENTTDCSDVQYLHSLQKSSSKVHVIKPTILPPGPVTSICQFFKNSIDPQTIYIRFDDDIVYIEPNFFERFLKFRIENPQFFLVFPNIVNNAICTFVQAVKGTIDPGLKIMPWCFEPTAWENPRFAEQLHRKFLQAVAGGKIADWYFGVRMLSLCRISINCMSWFGRDFAAFNGEVDSDEEQYLSVIKPSQINQLNCICGDIIVSHFAFRPQRKHLDSTDLLECYESLRTKATVPCAKPNRDWVGRNIWTPRLIDVLETISGASTDDLASPDYLAQQIRSAGLAPDRRLFYGSEGHFVNAGRAGLWQWPMQLARCLVQLSGYKISKVIDIGTFSGWTISVIAAYLRRFNDNLQVITVDVRNLFDCYSEVKRFLPIDFQVGKTSKDFSGEPFDLAILDGDHNYDKCMADYDAVGRYASICMFHDVNDRFVAEHPANAGGVPRVWTDLKAVTIPPDQALEFLDHPEGDRIMGIGLLVRQSVRTKRMS